MKENQELKIIQAYDFITLLQELEKAVLEGFTYDLANNTNSPQMIGHVFLVPMVRETVEKSTPTVEVESKPESSEAPKSENQQEQSEETPAKRARKAKSEGTE